MSVQGFVHCLETSSILIGNSGALPIDSA